MSAGRQFADAYRLLDVGAGRKLEQFGPWKLDRPAPGTETWERRNPLWWDQITARFERSGRVADAAGGWLPAEFVEQRCQLSAGSFQLDLRPTPNGQIGLFPEQAENWVWLDRQVRAGRPRPRLLNLFAYTGAATLAAAAAGAEVCHVDASRPTVAWARANAESSGLSSAPIRWIVDDCLAFVRREIRRRRWYDGVILDPPSYGHGANGQPWQLEHQIVELLSACRDVSPGNDRWLLLSCHTTGTESRQLPAWLNAAGWLDRDEFQLNAPADLPPQGAPLDRSKSGVPWASHSASSPCEICPMELTDAAGRRLHCGWSARIGGARA